MIENILPESDKIIINNYLDHVTNLSNYTGYLIKGITKNSNEIIHSNSAADYKDIKVNSLLSFSFNILQTLLGCDSQKLQYVQTELINDLMDYDVSFKSNEIQVKQILLNFISNSVKFTNHGSISIETRLKNKNQKDVLKLIIKDTGCGIKKEDKSELFQEYAKFNNTASNSYGTGLGLNICKSMADDMNMKIKFKSEESKGTKVTLYIFNPVVNEKEKYEIFQNPLVITDLRGDSKKVISLKGNSQKTSTYSTILRENEINMECDVIRRIRKGQTSKLHSKNKEDNIVNRNEKRQTTIIYSNNSELSRLQPNDSYDEEYFRKKTLVNQVMSKINYSLFSLKNSKTYESFDLDFDNMEPTKRLGNDHNYGINYSNTYNQNETISRQNLPIQTTKSSGNKNDHLSINCAPNSKPLKLNQVRENDETNGLREIEIQRKIDKPFISLSSKTFMTKKPQECGKILVVDDQLHARRALVNLITKYCKDNEMYYDIIEDCDGIECLNTIIRNPFNIRYVFIDQNMNYMNGTEAAKIIRSLSSLGKVGNINLILTSADDDVSYKKEFFDFCVSKPLGRRNLEGIIQNV